MALQRHARFYVTTLLLLAALGGFAAVTDATPNGTATPTNTTATPTPQLDANSTAVGSVGPVVDVLDYEYSGGTMTVLLEADTITKVTLSQQVENPSEGAQSFNIKSLTLSPGKTRVHIRAETVAITTPASVQAGRGLLVSTGGSGSLFGAFSGTDVAAAAFGGFGTCAVIVFTVARRRASSDDDPEVERTK